MPGQEASTRWLRAGVLAAAMASLALALLVGLAVPRFSSGDEAQHTSYALDVGHGQLPTITTPVRTEIPGMHRGITYTANHPPLFYAVTSFPLRFGEAVGRPLLGLHLARALNAVIGAIGVILVGALVRLLTPARPDLAVGAAAVAGLVLLYLLVAGQLYNDALSVATSTWALLAGFSVLVRGPTRRRIALACAAALVAAASRAIGIGVAGLAAAAVALGVWLHVSGRGRVRLVRAAAAGSLVVTVVAAGIGWFYARNVALYGDLTGAADVTARLPGAPVPLRRAFTSGDFWLFVYHQLWGRGSLLTGPLAVTARAFLLAVATGLGLAGIRYRWGARRRCRLSADAGAAAGSRATAPSMAEQRGRRLAFALLAAHAAVVLAVFIGYAHRGGAPFARYLLPALPELALVAAVGLAAFPSARRGIPTTCVAVAMAVSAVAMLGREVALKSPPLHGIAGRLRGGLASNVVAMPTTVLVVLAAVLVGSLMSVAAALWVLAARHVPSWSPGTYESSRYRQDKEAGAPGQPGVPADVSVIAPANLGPAAGRRKRRYRSTDRPPTTATPPGRIPRG